MELKFSSLYREKNDNVVLADLLIQKWTDCKFISPLRPSYPCKNFYYFKQLNISKDTKLTITAVKPKC